MRYARLAVTALLALGSSGCYHVVVETGLPLTTTSINQPWSSGYFWGLVPPHVVTAAVTCPGGRVAKVESHHSFLNELATVATLGIYSPVDIKVTCAS